MSKGMSMLSPETGFNIIPPDVAWEVVQILWQKVGCYAVWLLIAPVWYGQWKHGDVPDSAYFQ